MSEDCDSTAGPLWTQIAERAEEQGTTAVAICAELESALSEWPPEEAAEYRAELDMGPAGLERLVHAGYRLLDLLTFFTATGTNVVRAWTLRRGQTAYDAAGKVHTDMQRGFIRAEVIAYSDLMSAGDFGVARERGLVRVEGRDYIVADGDILHIRFSPPR